MKLDEFIDTLCSLDLDPLEIQADPTGEGWLPASLRRAIAEDPQCRAEFDEFVEMELALMDVHEPCDAFFTRRVMDSLPELEPIDDQRRTWILASAYALAIGLTYLLVGPVLSSGDLGSYFEPLHDWYHAHAVEAGGVWMVVALLCTAGVLVVLPTEGGGRHRPA